MDKQGLLLCARYAVAPNFFGYCGPDENKSLIDHLKDNIADTEVQTFLSEFETLYPYLQLIAKGNHIEDPFDKRVVEAYWLGNSLLHVISHSDYIALLQERMAIEKKIQKNKFITMKQKVFSKLFYPHHSFHVFNIFKRTGNDPSFHTLNTMDECRIGWGRVVEDQISNIKYQINSPKIKNLLIKTRPLVVKNNKLTLGESNLKELLIDYKGKSFFKNLKAGDWVSFHWGFVCDVLTDSQVRNLHFYTQKSIDFFNSK